MTTPPPAPRPSWSSTRAAPSSAPASASPTWDPTPIKAEAAEKHLVGKKADAITEAARLAAAATSPGADRRGAVDYKKEMARVLTTRALKKAYERAGGR